MSVASCFWALLSLENFDFIYLPEFITDTHIGFGKTAGDILLHHSLLQFIHPEELSLAKIDLMNFVQIKTLAGAVTRCRLKSIKSIIYQENGKSDNMSHRFEDWIITDVVMYTATKNTILTFFHSHEIENGDSTTTTLPISNCGSRQFHLKESNSILEILKIHSLPMQLKEPLRLFEIYDTQTKQLIISCPSCLYTHIVDDERTKLLIKSATELANILTLREMDKRIQQQLPPSLLLKEGNTACTHHSHSTSTAILEPYGLCKVETIIISYGSLTFSTYQITPMLMENNNTSTSRPSTSYHHYMHCAPVNNNNSANIESNRTNSIKRKSNIKDILNDNTMDISPLPSPASSLLPLLNHHQQQQQQQYIPKKYNINTDNNTKVSNSNNNKSPLPRAWRGRFGAYEKKCENCQTNASPEWRRGPSGHKTLCNACGLRYARLVAKHERQQAPKEEEDRSLFNPTMTKK